MSAISREDIFDLLLDGVTRVLMCRPGFFKQPDLAIEYLATVLKSFVGRNADERRGLYLELLRDQYALTDKMIGLNAACGPHLMEDIFKGEHQGMRQLGELIIFDVSMLPIGKTNTLSSENSLIWAEHAYRYLAEDHIPDRFSDLYAEFADEIHLPVIVLRETKTKLCSRLPIS